MTARHFFTSTDGWILTSLHSQEEYVRRIKKLRVQLAMLEMDYTSKVAPFATQPVVLTNKKRRKNNWYLYPIGISDGGSYRDDQTAIRSRSLVHQSSNR